MLQNQWLSVSRQSTRVQALQGRTTRPSDSQMRAWIVSEYFCLLLTSAGAGREALEEANAHVEVQRLLAVYSVPRISQVIIYHHAVFADDRQDFEAAAETSEVRPPQCLCCRITYAPNFSVGTYFLTIRPLCCE